MNKENLPLSEAASKLDLTIGNDAHEPVIRAYANIIQVDREAMKLRQRVAESKIDTTGIGAQRRLTRLESEWVSLHQELVEINDAIIETEPFKFPRVETSWRSKSSNLFVDNSNRFKRQTGETLNELERTFDALTAKQSAATARIGLLISMLAVFISVIAILVRLL